MYVPDMGTPLVVMLFVGLCYTQGTLVSRNVVFQKVNEVTTTRAQWLVTFVTDLKPYMDGMERLYKDVGEVQQVIWQIVSHYNKKGHIYTASFAKLGQEAKMIREGLVGLQTNFLEYRTLHTDANRDRRAIIPFIGKALGFLFGTVTDKELNTVKQHVNKLARNQEEIVHVVRQGLTLVNESRVEISKNRQAVESLLDGIEEADRRLRNVTEAVMERVLELETLVVNYVEIDTLVADVREVITRMSIYLEHLQLQINMLATGRLTPSTVTPSNLRKLLIEIKQRLKTPMRLSGNPEHEIWHFYKYLTCSTIFQDNKILSIVPVPLLDMQEELEVFQIHSLPLPDLQTATSGFVMTAEYELEAQAIALNKARTKLVLLNGGEIKACTTTTMGFCSIKSPLYPMYANEFCVTALFRNQPEKVRRHCQVKVKLNTTLPQAEYISEGRWMVSTQRPLTFNVLCPDSSPSTIRVEPPMKVVPLGMACVGVSEALTLAPYYKQESSFLVNDTSLNSINSYVVSNVTLWEPLHKQIPKLQPLEIPRKLGSVKEIELKPLIRRLERVDSTMETDDWTWWQIALCGTGLSIGVTLIVGAIGLLFKYKMVRGALSMNLFTRWCRKQKRASTPTLPSSDPAEASAMRAEGGITSSTDGWRRANDDVAPVLYPSLGQGQATGKL